MNVIRQGPPNLINTLKHVKVLIPFFVTTKQKLAHLFLRYSGAV